MNEHSGAQRSVFSLVWAGGAAIAPVTDAACIHMHESGARIVTDSASAERESRIAQRERLHARYADIDRMRLHVQTVFSNAGRMGAKERIAPGRTVATDDVNLRAGMSDCSGEIGKKIEDTRIVVLHFSRAVIAEKVIQLLFRRGNVFVAAAIDDINALAGVSVVETKMMFFVRRRVCCKTNAVHMESRKNSKNCRKEKQNDSLSQKNLHLSLDEETVGGDGH